MCSKFFDFWTNIKINFEVREFFSIVLYLTKRKCSPIEPQLKVEKEDGREAPSKPVTQKFTTFTQKLITSTK